MADPLTALGIAGNVVQFISFAGELIDRTQEIANSHDGALVKHTELETITTSILAFNDLITYTSIRYRKEKGKPQKDSLSPQELHEENLIELDEQLSLLCADCNSLAQQLLAAIADLKRQGSFKQWNTFRQALRSVWKEDKIADLSQRLDAYRTQIGMIAIASLTEHVQYNNITFRENLDQSISRLEERNQHSQMQLFENIRQHIDRIQEQGDSDQLASIISETTKRQREEVIQRKIMEKLKFHDMRDRHLQISEAHEKTYQWVFHDLGEVDQSSYTGVMKVGATAEAMSHVAWKRGIDAPSETSLTVTDNADGTQADDSDSESDDPGGWWDQLTARQLGNQNSGPAAWDSYRVWLESSGPLYWITGKPGSGKSTLMKLLYDDAHLSKYLQSWTGDHSLRKAGFFFWNAGTTMQMSKDGMLRTLLYEAIGGCLDLIPVLFPDRWTYSTLFGFESRDWSASELEQALITLVSDGSVKHFFMIDGLDEFTGEPRDLVSLILQCCAGRSNVKVCVASRPWIPFESGFRHYPRLHMEEMTASDIGLYVSDRFHENDVFKDRMEMKDQVRTCQKLLRNITRRAKGVFLWVKLVTNLLLHKLENGGSIEELHAALSKYPPGLNNLFDGIWAQIRESEYFEESAGIFRRIQTAKNPVPLLVLLYAEEGPEKALDDNICCLSVEADHNFADQMRRRIKSRCGGFLESPAFKEQKTWAKVEYLHRTVKDYLLQDQIFQSLTSASNTTSNQIVLTLCTGFLRCIKKLDGSQPTFLPRFKYLTSNCLDFSKIVEEVNSEMNLRILLDLNEAAGSFFRAGAANAEQWIKEVQKNAPYALKPDWTNLCTMATSSSSFLEFALQQGFYSYVEHTLKQQYHSGIYDQSRLSNFLVIALDHDRIDIKFFSVALQNGADPNIPADGYESSRVPWYHLLYLLSVTGQEVMASSHGEDGLSLSTCKRLGTIADLFLDHGADPFIRAIKTDAIDVIKSTVGQADAALASRLVSKLEAHRKLKTRRRKRDSLLFWRKAET